MNGPTRRLASVLFIAFGVLLGSLTWFQVLGADRYRSDPRNARTSLSLSQKERGIIAAADGTVLARSEPDPVEAQRFLRVYPEGAAYAHVVGYSSLLVGSYGLEEAYAEELRSRRDLTISDVIAALLGRDLRPLNVQTTLQPRVQEAAIRALNEQRGAVVALEPSTGAVLAYVTSPSFDPSGLLGPDSVTARQALIDDPDEPLLDRAGRQLYAPGSTFKTIVAGSALETGLAGPESTFPDTPLFDLPGSEADIANSDGGLCAGGDMVTLQVAFARSCNTIFADLAIRLGAEAIGVTAEAMGFNREISFPWELAESAFNTRELSSDPAALGQSGIGERDVRATPLVMAMVAAAVANEGEVMQPHIVAQVFDATGNTVEATESERLGRALSPATATVLGQMMERAVTEGTGRRASVPGVRVAGKTGTAQGAGGAPDVWFIAFAPVDDPTIALAVLVEDGGFVGESASGGSVAAPIAADVISAWLSG